MKKVTHNYHTELTMALREAFKDMDKVITPADAVKDAALRLMLASNECIALATEGDWLKVVFSVPQLDADRFDIKKEDLSRIITCYQQNLPITTVTPLRRFASSFTYWVVVSDDRLEKMFGVIGLAGMESGAELYVEGIARLASFVATLRDRERDALTKGVRQEVFWMDFRDCVSRAGLRDRPYSLLCIDLDKFKPVNDTHGHEAGDAVLRSIGQLIIETIRKDDLYGRVGGDEFCVAGEMTYDEANVLAGRIRDRVHSQAEKLHSVTCSIGVYSWWPTVTDDGARARRVADNASLAAKAARCPAGHTFSIRDHKVCPKCGAVPADLGGNRVIAKQSRSPRSTQRRGEQNA